MSKLGIEGGAKISGIRDSNFRETGIADGFIITRIDKNKVSKPQDVQRYSKPPRKPTARWWKASTPTAARPTTPSGRPSKRPVDEAGNLSVLNK